MVVLVFFNFLLFSIQLYSQSSEVPSLKNACFSKVMYYLQTEPRKLLPHATQEKTKDEVFVKIFQSLPTDLIQEIHRGDQEPLQDIPEFRGAGSVSGSLIAIDKGESWEIRSLEKPKDKPLLKGDFTAYQLLISPQQKYVAAQKANTTDIYSLNGSATNTQVLGACPFGRGFFFDKNEHLIVINEQDDLKLFSFEDQGSEKLITQIYKIIAYLSASHSVFIKIFNDPFLKWFDLDKKEFKSLADLTLDPYSVKAVFSITRQELLAISEWISEASDDSSKNHYKLTIFNLTQGAIKLATIELPSMINSACFDNTGEYIAVGTNKDDHGIYIFDISKPDLYIFSQKIYEEVPIIILAWDKEALKFRDVSGRFYRLHTHPIIKAYEYLKKLW